MQKILNFFKKDPKTEFDVGPLHLYWGTDPIVSQTRKRKSRLHIFFHKKARLQFALSVLILLLAAPVVYNHYFKPKIASAADTFIKMDEGYGTSSAVHDT